MRSRPAYSPTQARRKAFADKYKFPVSRRSRCHLGRQEHRLRRDPDAAQFASRSRSRRGQSRQACAAGKAAGNHHRARGRDGRKPAATAKVTFGVVLQHRFRAPGVKLREIFKSGDLGKMVGCSAVVPNWRPQTYYDQPGRGTKARDGGGVLITQGIHTLDLMLSSPAMWTKSSPMRPPRRCIAWRRRISSARVGEIQKRRASASFQRPPRPIRALASASRSSAKKAPPSFSAPN